MVGNVSRRGFLKASSVLLSFTVGGKTLLLTPAQAKEKQLPLQVLSQIQAEDLEIVADALVPGARQAGIVHYIDSQLAVEPENTLLMLRYLGVPAPYDGFYSSSLNSIKKSIETHYQKQAPKLNEQEIAAFIGDMAKGTIKDWQGPPSEFFYFVLRADAADVVYGTQEGFSRLDIPYMPHILPKQKW